MNPVRAIALLVLAAPAAALAQTSYSTATVLGPPPVVLTAEGQACWDRHDTLAVRKSWLDEEKANVDRDGAAIARESAQLADEKRLLVSTDASAVAAYNTRSAAHNRRVAAHNARVADMNLAASLHNDAAANMVAYCNLRTYRWRDDAYVSTLR